MNRKSKWLTLSLLLTSSSLIAGVTATAAWFTAHRAARNTFSTITVNTESASISSVVTAVRPASFHEASSSTSRARLFDNDFQITDVSSQFGDEVYIRSSTIDGYTLVTSEMEGYFLQFRLTVTAAMQTGNTDLTINTSITPSSQGNTASVALASWTRIGVIEYDAGWENQTENGFKKAFKNAWSANPIFINGVSPSAYAAYSADEKETTGTDVALGTIGPSGGSKYYLVSIWMEGTEATNMDAARGGTMSVAVTVNC